MLSFDDWHKVKKAADAETARLERLKGQMDAAMLQLRELGYETVEEAEKASGELRKEVIRLHRLWVKKLTRFKKEARLPNP